MQAKIRVDGSIQCEGLTGSIHQVGRKLLDGPCNGWEQWFYKNEHGEMKPLDVLREMYLSDQQTNSK